MNRLPRHVVELAQAFRDGVDCGPMLADALREEGYEHCALWCFGLHPDRVKLRGPCMP